MSIWDKTAVAADGSPGEAQDDGVLTVAQAVELANGKLKTIPRITIIGEVSGFKGPWGQRGHCYFAIKDEDAALQCRIWGGVYQRRSFDLENGQKVQFTGRFDVYKAKGELAFIADSFSMVGEGLLRQQVDALARKLRGEGLMDESRKRPIPAFCERVAVVTSLSGAVIDDVKQTLQRRNPFVEIICVSAKVQGEGAPEELIEGLARAAAIKPAPDCILLVRGGGSYEDLMAFNDEALARAVAACPLPVVTGIGHEPDNSICDMVSDRRMSTPTAAAESVAPARKDLVELLAARAERLQACASGLVSEASADLDAAQERASRAMGNRLDRLQTALDAVASRPVLTKPTASLEQRVFELDRAEERLQDAGGRVPAAFTAALDRLSPRLANATAGALGSRRHALSLMSSRLSAVSGGIVEKPAAKLAESAAKLEALSPLKVLARGYSIAYNGDEVATSISDFVPGGVLSVRLADGRVYGTVNKVEGTASAVPTGKKG